MKNVDTKKNFAKRITVLTILLIALSISNAWGVSVAYDFSVAANNPGNAQDWFSDDIGAYASWSATTGGSNNPKYYDTGSGLRIYNGGKFTITSDINMSSITLTFSSSSYTFSTSNTNATQTVSPNAKTYEWSVSRTCRLQRVEITFASGGCSAIDVTGGSAVTLPAGSTTYNTSDWLRAGAAFAYPTSATTYSIGDDAYCVSLKDVADFKDATGIRFKNGSVLTISNIVSNYGIDVEIVASGTNNFTVSLSGAASNVTGNNTTLSISTTSTTATLTISKSTSNQGNITYIKITPKTAACSANPTIGNASINSSFTLTSLTSNIGSTQGLSSGTCNTGNAGCSWSDRGFVWGTTSSPTTSDHKEAGGSGDQATSWTGTLHPSSSWAVGTPYYVKTYGQNSNPSGSIVYSTTATSFTLRSIDFEENGGSTVNMIYCNSGGTATKPTDPTKDGNTFAGWYKEAGLNNVVDWENDAVSENKTYYAKWNTTVCTITLNQNGATTSSSPTSVNATYGSGSLSSAITNPEKMDYIFGGWYSGSGGTGSLVIGTDGTLQANVAGYTDASGNWAKDATSTTLYANWTEHTYTNYRTSCCPTKVTLVGSVPSGHGTVTFSPTGPVTTCDEDKEVTMTITPDAGYQLTAFTASGVSPKSTGAIATSGDASKTTQNVTVTFNEDQATGTYTGIATFSIMTDYYKDKLHNTTGYTGDGATRSGGNYSVPDDISNTTPGSGCENEHYVFVGWVDAGHVAADGSLLSGYSLFKGGTKDASGTTYYAIWAKDIE